MGGVRVKGWWMQADQVLCIRQGARAGSRWVPVCAQAGRGRCRQAGACACRQVHVQASRCMCRQVSARAGRQVPVHVADACGQVLGCAGRQVPGNKGRQVHAGREHVCPCMEEGRCVLQSVFF